MSSSTAIDVVVEKATAPRCRPLTIRPSFLYCSMGIQNRSFTPWTTDTASWTSTTRNRHLCLSFNIVLHCYSINTPRMFPKHSQFFFMLLSFSLLTPFDILLLFSRSLLLYSSHCFFPTISYSCSTFVVATICYKVFPQFSSGMAHLFQHVCQIKKKMFEFFLVCQVFVLSIMKVIQIKT